MPNNFENMGEDNSPEMRINNLFLELRRMIGEPVTQSEVDARYRTLKNIIDTELVADALQKERLVEQAKELYEQLLVSKN